MISEYSEVTCCKSDIKQRCSAHFCSFPSIFPFNSSRDDRIGIDRSLLGVANSQTLGQSAELEDLCEESTCVRDSLMFFQEGYNHFKSLAKWMRPFFVVYHAHASASCAGALLNAVESWQLGHIL